jgi:hypothetical protein
VSSRLVLNLSLGRSSLPRGLFSISLSLPLFSASRLGALRCRRLTNFTSGRCSPVSLRAVSGCWEALFSINLCCRRLVYAGLLRSPWYVHSGLSPLSASSTLFPPSPLSISLTVILAAPLNTSSLLQARRLRFGCRSPFPCFEE